MNEHAPEQAEPPTDWAEVESIEAQEARHESEHGPMLIFPLQFAQPVTDAILAANGGKR